MEVRDVLVVDDCKHTRAACACDLGSHRRVLLAESVPEARTLAREVRLDLVLVDQRLGRGSLFAAGLAFIAELRQLQPEACIAFVTGFLTPDSECLALRFGADLALEKKDDSRGSWIPVDEILRHVENGTPAAVDRSTFRSLERVERDAILDALRCRDGNIANAARGLKVHRRTIQKRIDGLVDIEHGKRTRRRDRVR